MEKENGKIAIIGSGLIGRCWAIIFSKAGYEVALYDVNAKQMTLANQAIDSQLQDLVKSDVIQKSESLRSKSRISFTNDLQRALNGAIYVQECIPEVLTLKKELFSQIDRIISPETIVGSSTSCIVPSMFVEGLQNCGRYLAAHPVNPPHFIPLVELVPSPWTEQAVIDKVKALMQDIGQAPIVVKKEVNGFVLNRLQYALIMEGWRMVEDGVCSPEDVDTTISQGLGPRYALMGPFETMHLNAPQGFRDYCDRYGSNIFKICQEQSKPRQLKGYTCDIINQSMCARIPLDQLDTRRKWRDENLASIACLKNGPSLQNGDDGSKLCLSKNDGEKRQIAVENIPQHRN